ncbi:DUF4465 domain-containing protein [Neolewinella antarctica]|uniref:Secretion system C-terminal sorting domain-containing protein n=1 Tax=Neolewinella antarctica TaxID=442734 RepID=A0ABX0X7U2_9BACT|nr:DUF4465 domain-containing protein [Neolewinella antarctica]NJC24902.1 hypothetical protein [Neolewinella antarctica]
MKLYFTSFFLLLAVALLPAQDVVDFESFDLEIGTFLNGSDGNGGFQAGDAFFPNSFTQGDGFSFWSGWSISSTTDTISPGFTNQYSSITGSGFGGSTTYGVAFDTTGIKLSGTAATRPVPGFYVTNSTYAFFTLRDGNQFSKRFGGLDGNDADFFLLTIKGYVDDTEVTDSVDFYLADYRFEDNDEDYILSEWEYVDLSGLGVVDSLSFSLSSTDRNSAGILTPAYFCVDDFFSAQPVSVRTPVVNNLFKVYPNPTADEVQISYPERVGGRAFVTSITGSVLLEQSLGLTGGSVNLRSLPAGRYVVTVRDGLVQSSKIVVKQ